ncbi:hypothetical protein BT96DRAFT_1019089 [Gymnopus androsaceus JB14]|uniref:Uncharacterized protein n=1 Tax=Gymnopus androsaceus JB14 TaxID=1447944 RepID=A0A6A4HPZ0_9AGAR|nr:hypothetical protein BT96DRAFT_1019089 [Gymnopus androsaceus JB14]
MHFTPTFLPILMHGLVSVARAVPLHANAGLGDLAIRAPLTIRCAVTNQQGGTSIVHDEARTTKMVQWVLEDKYVMETVLGSTVTPQITFPSPSPYAIKKPRKGLSGIYQSIAKAAEVSGVRLAYFQILGGYKTCRTHGIQTLPCYLLVGEDARGDPLFGIINLAQGKSLSLQGSLALASFSGSPTPNLNKEVMKVAESSVRWLFQQPEMIAKFGSLVIAFLNDFPLPSIPPDDSVHFQFYGAHDSPCPKEKPCFALVGINHGHAVHYGAVWDYDYGLGVDQARKPIVVAQVTVPRAQEIASTHASEHRGPQ